MNIRLATRADDEAIWAIMAPVIRTGETYALPRDMGREEALAKWFPADRDTFVMEDGGAILGTYVIGANQAGGGAHVANCGFMTAAAAQGRGVARAMCAHAFDHARALGFLAMQFNFVVSTNTRAVALWQAMGMEIVGRVPGAFAHPSLGYVDVLVMFRRL